MRGLSDFLTGLDVARGRGTCPPGRLAGCFALILDERVLILSLVFSSTDAVMVFGLLRIAPVTF